MPSKMIYISDDLCTLLKGESNGSALIQRLLRDHYSSKTPEMLVKSEMSNLKSKQKELKLALKSAEKKRLKEVDLQKMKDNSPDGSLAEYQIKAWELKWQ